MSLESVSGLVLWNQTYQKHFSLGNFWFVPSNEFNIKICCPPKFIGSIPSGRAGLEAYILYPELASGLQTHTYTFLIDVAI